MRLGGVLSAVRTPSAAALWVLGAQLLLRLLAIGVLMLTLGPLGQGRVAVAQLIALVGGTLVAAGLEQALVATAGQQDQKSGACRVALLHPALVAGLAVPGTALLAAAPAVSLQLVVGVAALAPSVAVRLWAAVALGQSRMVVYALLSVCPFALYALALCVLLVAGLLDTQVALIAIPTVYLAVALTAVPWVASTLWAHRKGPSLRNVTYETAAALAPGVAAQLANYRLDQVLIGGFLGPRELGYYSIAVSSAEVATLPATARAQILLRDADRRGIRVSMCRSIMKFAPAGLLTAGPFLVFIEAFAPAYQPSLAAYLLLLPGSVAVGATRIVAAVATARGRGVLASRAALVALVMGVPAMTIGIGAAGITGAACAASTTYTVTGLLLFRWWRTEAQRVPASPA